MQELQNVVKSTNLSFVEASRSYHLLKGIFQPFELGGVTRLIRSAVKLWKAGNNKKKFNDTNSREELKTN
jgi:hypothetical protein